ncbi:MAG: hypothetical protein ACN4E6_01415 [Qipengyuania pacifica]
MLDHHGLADDAFRAEWAARRAPLVTGAAELPEARRLKERLEPPQRALPDDTPVALTELASFDALLEGRA